MLTRTEETDLGQHEMGNFNYLCIQLRSWEGNFFNERGTRKLFLLSQKCVKKVSEY